MTEDEIKQEVHWIDAEPGWPRWPLLPVKNVRRGDAGYPEDEGIGVLVAGRRKVYLKNLWDFVDGPLGAQLEGVKTLEFEDTEALVRAGWIGD